MYEKIFWEISSAEELNELANNLRNTKEFDEIRLLCKENNIPEDITEKYIDGSLVTLATMGYLESRKALQSPTWKAAREVVKNKKCKLEKDQGVKKVRKVG